ncbi:MBL fold metallo-hydrolase [Rhodovulum steppense]|uniref:Glyoxylase-like metal-dependent hydrolase (Beta-lactamase superfamily II) n=1 Tax=Rhodovulum steppense TaxID=540251 RepID=A0A4R1YLL9_9RHOB|nr:MBL fold metallo-hydrolase [Rhodovulum steppense]TCM78341.1 glyoxylase-like metal-dependent hydrolase (beta-lactamase superfamily II) [Rhodovulum steppense]
MSNEDFDPRPGACDWLRTGLRRVLAPNPSPMTFRGTNTYLLGEGHVAVIDPGPLDPAHLDALMAALGPGETISHIFVTHSHLDHSALARPLAQATGAPVLAFGNSAAGRRVDLAALAGLGGGEGIDAGFAPDVRLAHGDRLVGEGWQIEALHTPGHMGNHICLAWQDALFTGDHVMGWASSMVSPPDGDLAAFMASLDLLAGRPERVLFPGHGAPVADGPARIVELTAHRRKRAARISEALAAGPATAQALARAVYTDTPPALLPAATRNVLAHLIEMADKSLAEPEGQITATALWHRL